MKIEFHAENEMPFERKISVSIKSNKNIHQFTDIYPVTWTGFINDQKVEFIQKTDAAITIDDFELICYPEKYKYLFSQIIKYIDNESDF